jgi:hypothetical protein
LEFQWKWTDSRWVLEPVAKKFLHAWRITVEKLDGDFWSIFVAGRSLALRYTSEQGAKLDAWEFITSKRKTLLGVYSKPKLVKAAGG